MTPDMNDTSGTSEGVSQLNDSERVRRLDDDYCVVIPHYRHTNALLTSIPAVLSHGLAVLVVDDGSGAEWVARLAQGLAGIDGVTLVERGVNGGKGAAMISGLEHARALGFTHVISLDADGQHDPADITRFRVASQTQPLSLFSGAPVFGDDIPAVRLYGREITNHLARWVTGSPMLRDAMCGLRLYPLGSVLPLCRTLGSRKRMQFDTEILVRACWSGLQVDFIDTKVVYPESGTSHFKMVRDNALLVLMHIRLIAGGLLRRLTRSAGSSS